MQGRSFQHLRAVFMWCDLFNFTSLTTATSWLILTCKSNFVANYSELHRKILSSTDITILKSMLVRLVPFLNRLLQLVQRISKGQCKANCDNV